MNAEITTRGPGRKRNPLVVCENPDCRLMFRAQRVSSESGWKKYCSVSCYQEHLRMGRPDYGIGIWYRSVVDGCLYQTIHDAGEYDEVHISGVVFQRVEGR